MFCLDFNLWQKILEYNTYKMLEWGSPGSSDIKESAFNARDPESIPGLERSPWGGNGNPLQYSCLETPVYL